MPKRSTNDMSVEQQLYELSIAAKTLKIAVERAARLLWTDRLQAEQMLARALKQAEDDGI